VVKTRIESHKRVLTWFAGRRCKRQPKRAKRPHSKFSDRKALNGPAMRPKNSACRGEWRREAGSPARVRLMSAREREIGDEPRIVPIAEVVGGAAGLCLPGGRIFGSARSSAGVVDGVRILSPMCVERAPARSQPHRRPGLRRRWPVKVAGSELRPSSTPRVLHRLVTTCGQCPTYRTTRSESSGSNPGWLIDGRHLGCGGSRSSSRKIG